MSKNEIKTIQKALLKLGHEPGKIDGICGPRTREAIVSFKMEVGLKANANLNGLIKKQLFTLVSKTPRFEPMWLACAKNYLGIREIKGKKNNWKIVSFFKSIGSKFRNDSTPWCAAFVGAVLEELFISSTKSPAARSYRSWGIKLEKPAVGSIVVFWRGSRFGWSGHVGFIVGMNKKGKLLVLGGNQGDEVNVKAFDKKRVLSYVWPVGVSMPRDYKLPSLKDNYEFSTNEA